MSFKIGDSVIVNSGYFENQRGEISDIWSTEVALIDFDGERYVLPFSILEEYRVRGFEPTKNAPQDTLLPVRGSEKCAGYDFYAPCDIVIPAKGRTENIFLNVKAYMQDDEYLQIKIRSSLAVKHSIVLETSGVIDADYYGNETTDGNISVVLRNNGDKKYVIKKGERICQGIFFKYLTVDNDKSLGARRGGFGSTGV